MDENGVVVIEGCGLERCGLPQRIHGQRWLAGLGWHTYMAPTKEQIRERMRQKYGLDT